MPHENLGYLFLAFAATWAAFFAYLFFVQRQLLDVRRRLADYEEHAASAAAAPRETDSDDR